MCAVQWVCDWHTASTWHELAGMISVLLPRASGLLSSSTSIPPVNADADADADAIHSGRADQSIAEQAPSSELP